MNQDGWANRVGYALKRAQSALNVAMDDQLRPLGLGVSQYACLAQLDANPGMSNAELARAVFVSRQATHQLLGTLTAPGWVRVTGGGRRQRLDLTPAGESVLDDAAAVVAQVEERMLSGLSATERAELAGRLTGCADALEETPEANPRA